MGSDKKINIRLSDLAILISVAIIAAISFDMSLWKDDKKVIESDMISYYAYLPATFIYQDLSLRFVDKMDPKEGVKVWFEELEPTEKDSRKRRVIKTTVGVAYYYLPFFILSHQLSGSFGYANNGYTKPYRVGIILSSVFFFFIGLFYLKRILLKYFNDKTVFLTILIIGAGTNLVNYVTKEAGMSHVYSFATFAAVIYYLDMWYRDFKKVDLFKVAFLFGMAILIRPTNLLFLLVLLLYKVKNYSDLKTRLQDLVKNIKPIILGAFIFLIPFIPQLLYWKYSSGEWLFFSYTDNEKFFFNDPKIIKGLFSYKKGWLLYTPLMSLAFIGLLLPVKKIKEFRWSILIFLCVLVYVTFSWWSWYYGGSFSSRPMIDHYALFSLPIAAVVNEVLKRGVFIRIIGSLVILAFIFLNQFQHYQYSHGYIHHSGMTKETYWMVFLDLSPLPKDYYDRIEIDDIKAQKKGISR